LLTLCSGWQELEYVANAWGITTITLVATDGWENVTMSFQVLVNEVNDPPYVVREFPVIEIIEDSGVGPEP
jgi:hypothetical protein